MNISAKYEFFGKIRNFRTLQKKSDFTKKFILYDFHTLPKNSYFTEIFVLYWKFRTLPKNSYTRWTGAEASLGPCPCGYLILAFSTKFLSCDQNFAFSVRTRSFAKFFALTKKNLSGSNFFCFSCQNLVMRHSFSSPAKNCLCNKYFCFSRHNFVVWQFFFYSCCKKLVMCQIFLFFLQNLDCLFVICFWSLGSTLDRAPKLVLMALRAMTAHI